MGLKILQVNLNHCKDAQDLCYKYMHDNEIDITCIAEPHSILENYQWIGMKGGTAAVLWNPNSYKGNIKTIVLNKNYVIIQADDIIVISVYISPNINIKQVEDIIDKLTIDIIEATNKKMIICGDFNAHSYTWGSRKESARGKLLNEWMASMNLETINRGIEPTCVRVQGSSIVDITMITTRLNECIKTWKIEERETLSDHKYIIIEIAEHKNKGNRNRKKQKREKYLPDNFTRWKWEKTNEDLFFALMIGYEWKVNEEGDPVLQAENIKKR